MFLRDLFRKTGFDLIRYPPFPYDLKRRAKLLRGWDIELLLDVGANEGQYGLQMRRIGYQGRIISFEPLDSAREVLETAAAADGNWQVRAEALGDEDAQSVLHVAGNSQSSSLLPMRPAHIEAAPGSVYMAEQPVSLRRLDGLWDNLEIPPGPMMLQIDAQGLEKKILEGCGEKLENFTALQLELSLQPLYEGETGLQDMLAWLSDRGWTLVSLEPGFDNPASGKLLQVDGLFEKGGPDV